MTGAVRRGLVNLLTLLGLGLAACLVGLCIYAGLGFADALRDAPQLAQRADGLVAAGHGPADLGPGRFEQLLLVEDPAFARHGGVDFATPGAGMTTLTQALAKTLAFERFQPGLGKIRQTTYALGLEVRLTKEQIAALVLDNASFGRGPDGWMTGLFATSQTVFGRPPAELTDDEFRHLVAVLIAPGRLSLMQPNAELEERVRRIQRLETGDCAPRGLRDVWLEGCA